MTREQAIAQVTARYRETFGEEPHPDAVNEAVETMLANNGFARMSGKAPEPVVKEILDLTNDILVCCSDAANQTALNAMTWAAVSLCRSVGVTLADFIAGMQRYEKALNEDNGGREIPLRRNS